MAKTIMEAINKNQSSFKGDIIYYLNTFITFGKYKDYSIGHVIEHDVNYIFWIIKTTKCYVSDEVSIKIKQYKQ